MVSRSIRNTLINIVGENNYLDSVEDRICYSYDATRKKSLPEAVIFPTTVSQVSEIMKLANRYKIPVVPRGAGSGMTGGAVPSEGGMVMVMNNFNRILEIDTDNLQAIVEPGVVTSSLHDTVEKAGLFYPPDPASMKHASIGGNIAENSGGMRAVKYGVTKDYVMGLEVVIPTGEIIHTGSKCVKDVVGYNLTQLFVGSEGTLGIVTKAILKLLPLPEAKKTLTATFSSMELAAKTVSGIIKKRIIPTTMEFLDKHSICAVEDFLHIGLPTNAGALLLIEVDGDADLIGKDIERIRAVCQSNQALEIKTAADEKELNELWKARRSVSPSLLKIRHVKINEDIVVPRSKIPDIIQKIEKIADKHHLVIVNFGHAGDGNVHVNVLSSNDNDELTRASHAVDDIFNAVIELDGRISGEHGIGITKRDYIELCIDKPTLSLMRQIKKLLDPNNILNPGKIFP